MSDDEWTYEPVKPGDIPTRYRVVPERVYRLATEWTDILAADADKRGMTLLEYVGWVGRMPHEELLVYRDRVRKGVGGPEFEALYDAWLYARTAVQVTQMWIADRWHQETDYDG
ncbi:hypothetical protein [Streptomyces sp. NPDC002057]|uniref:hypothetical protein n=1 Tax=Streptomyces sp. NPDC002057 TaxID=3154664 RepID=UPI00332D156E